MTRSPRPPAKIGRPSKYSDEWAQSFCEMIAQGKSVPKICEDERQPTERSVYNWLHTRDDFFQAYARAREERADRLFEELFEIADKPCTNQVEVQQQRNRLDTRKWALSKLAPRRYGDRVEHDVKGGGFQPAVLIQIGDGAPEPVDVSGKVIERE